jgi:very-short-patch-repair endonuclease
MICENCKTEHNGEYGSGRFCSSKCARGFSTKEKRSLINEIVSSKLKKDKIKKYCEYCKVNECKSEKSQTCSRSCSAKLKWERSEYKEKMSKILSDNAFRLHEKNVGFGWKTRKKLEPSYPESIAIRVLNELDVNYEREYKIEKYFIDFVLPEYKIAIEIDGKQHNIPSRKETDNRKDVLMRNSGWQIYRIKYPEDNIIESIKNILASIPSA